jgi:hypothetical protein
MTISIHDIEAVHQVSCGGHSCDAMIVEETAEQVLIRANEEGWVERDFDEEYHGILCGECDAHYGD